MVFFTAQCKFVTTMDSVCKEAVENTLWTNKVGTVTSTRSQTVLKSICLVNETNKCEASDQKITPHKSKAIASFDPTNNIAKNFFLWLTGSGGGCRSYWEAQPIISKCLKFLKFCCKDKEELTYDMVDFSLCLPNLPFKFVHTMQDDWNLGHAGRK